MLKQALFIILLCAAAGCTRHTADMGSLPVIIVNGQTLKASQFGKDVAKRLKNFDALAAKDPINVRRAKETVLREYIVTTLLLQYAQDHHIDVTADEVNQELDRIRHSYPDDLTFKSALVSENQTIDEWKAALKNTLIQRKVFEVIAPGVATDKPGPDLLQAAKKYFEEHKAEFEKPAQVHIQQIVVAKEDDAERLLQKIKKGAPIGELAKRYSISPDSEKNGDIGYISKGTVPAFDTAFNMRVGQLSPVIKSSYGFHIIRLLDKKAPGRMTFEQAKDGILRKLAAQEQQEAFNKWLDQAIKSAKVQRNDGLIEKIKVRTEGELE